MRLQTVIVSVGKPSKSFPEISHRWHAATIIFYNSIQQSKTIMQHMSPPISRDAFKFISEVRNFVPNEGCRRTYDKYRVVDNIDNIIS